MLCRFTGLLRNIIFVRQDGSFVMDHEYFGFIRGSRLYSNKFVKAFGKPRGPGEELEQRHMDIAASLQKFVEDTLMAMARNLYKETKRKQLCLAGGLFLNCVANYRILNETPFDEVFIQPAAGDAGGAIGVASFIYNSVFGKTRKYVMKDAYLGPAFSDREIYRNLMKEGYEVKEFEEDELVRYVARKIFQNKIVGWFQGRMEFGPRALGNRSILANPCNPEMNDLLNRKVKKRETFRPYAPMVLEEKAGEFFELEQRSPFMLLAPKVREKKRKYIPAVTHVDGTARVQTISSTTNPLLWKLLKEFEKIAKVPILINTSLNLRNEPIACTVDDAIGCYKKSEMDCLVLGRYVVERDERNTRGSGVHSHSS